jgi:hypothetical protein
VLSRINWSRPTTKVRAFPDHHNPGARMRGARPCASQRTRLANMLRPLRSDFRIWYKRFTHWLFGADHISVRYEIAYDGVDIRKLSPGMRSVRRTKIPQIQPISTT